VIIEDMDRNDLYFALQEAGVPTSSLYHALIPQITRSEFPVSHKVSRTISNLPIHQTMTHADIDFMISTLHRILGN
jgi:dTDP-4-amino-4,6-dideoxygalactose transaminase